MVGNLDVLHSLQCPLWTRMLETAESLGRAGTPQQIRADTGGQSWSELLLARNLQFTLLGWDQGVFYGENGFLGYVDT